MLNILANLDKLSEEERKTLDDAIDSFSVACIDEMPSLSKTQARAVVISLLEKELLTLDVVDGEARVCLNSS
ncbi:hypothetical protein LCGC14_1733420 [marine sediment metagenome]|uniref:Uncharacterized protein n=1 Tax=marine sediment metagenome TaxID=412755 RepID=A0A0F9H8U9_9ZZZZ